MGRNTARGSTQYWLNLFVSYSRTFGPRVVPPGGAGDHTPAGLSVTSFTPPEQGRYRITFNVFVYNLTNRTNLTGYSGVLTSPFFGRPNGAVNQRRMNLGMSLGL